MAVRRESVVLDLEDRLTPGMLRAAAATGVLDHELNKLSGDSVNTSRSVSRAEGEVQKLGRTSESGGRSIDKLSGRLGLLVQVGLAVGPALVPIGAVGVQAIAGLSSEMGFAAIGAGTMVLAFHNVGKALTAFNKAELAPTTANIAAAQQAMDALPPSAQRLVLTLHQLQPELSRLQESAASGFFPGLTAGLQSVRSDGPLAERAIHGIGLELGHLAHEAGDALASDEWRPFLKFIGRDAPLELDKLGHATGDVTHGLAMLWMALDPANRNFSAGTERVAADFDRWATNLDKSKDFQSFMQYVDQNGPRVVALLGDTAQLFTDIVRAAAPLGGPTLQALDLIVKALDLIASSPLATPLLALAQINAILKLTSRGLGAVGVSSDLNLKKKLTQNAKAASGGLFAVTSAQDRARLSAQQLEERQSAARAEMARGAAVMAGFALASSGVANSMGLQNTTMLATAGLMIGPWGAAVGGAVGLAMDWEQANKASAAEVDELNQSVSSLASSGNIAALGKFAEQANAGIDAVSGLGAGLGAQLDAKLQIPVAAFNKLSESISSFNTGLTGDKDPVTKLTDIQAVANRMQPAMTKLGLSFDDLLHMDSSKLDGTITRLVHITNVEESTKGQTDAVAKAFAGMSNEALTTDQRVQALTTSLDDLIDPMLNVGQAHDAFTQGLNDIGKALSTTSKTLRGNSDAAIQNRQAIRQQVTTLKTWIDAQASANVPAKTMTANLKAGRQAIIDQGKAAGLNADQIQHMLNVMHLTPKLIKTAMELTGVAEAEKKLDILTRDRIAQISVGIHATGGHIAPDPSSHADGGTIGGRRAPYGDKVLMWGAPGEEVISNRRGQADRHRELLRRINAGHYENGGTVGRSSQGGAAGPIHFGPLEMTIDLKTPWGTQKVHAVATQAAREVYASESASDRDFDRRQRYRE